MKIILKRSFAFLLCMIFIYNIGIYYVALENSKKKNLFFNFQSLSCISAAAIALSKKDEINDIVVSGGANRDPKVINGLKKIFDHVYVDNADNLSEKYDNVFSAGCVTEMKNEKFESYVKKGAKGIIYDEGSSAYIGYPVSCQNISKRSFLMFPQYRAGTLKNFSSEQISREMFSKAVKILYNPELTDKKIVFCLSLSSRPEFNMKLNKSIFNELKNFEKVAVKCHPYERRKFLFSNNIKELDRHIPFESFCYGFNGILIANLCSTLQTAKFMQPNSTVICTEFLDKREIDFEKMIHSYPGDWKHYVAMLKELGVLFPKTIAELKSMISQNINKI